MKIDISQINDEDFRIIPVVVADTEATFISPKYVGATWIKDNLIFRSSIWNKETGELISAGFPKFVNWLEAPQLYGYPSLMEEVNAIEKKDGSCIIASYYNGEVILRTRGSSRLGFDDPDVLKEINDLWDETHLEEELKNLYNKEIPVSFLFEYVSPRNQIVISHSKPELYLIGAVRHEDYSLLSQWQLDDIASMYSINRPVKYNFSSLDEMIEWVQRHEDIEGLVVYYNDDQNLRKLKSSKYLTIHAFKSGLYGSEKIIKLFLLSNRPSQKEFEQQIGKEWDFECIEFVQDLIDKLEITNNEVNKSIKEIEWFINSSVDLSRKDFAKWAMSCYSGAYLSLVFTLYDKKDINQCLYNIFAQALEKKEVVNETKRI